MKDKLFERYFTLLYIINKIKKLLFSKNWTNKILMIKNLKKLVVHALSKLYFSGPCPEWGKNIKEKKLLLNKYK